jgi:hypothetical protein
MRMHASAPCTRLHPSVVVTLCPPTLQGGLIQQTCAWLVFLSKYCMQTYLTVIRRDAELVAAHMKVLMALVPCSNKWSAQHNRQDLSPETTQGYRAFQHEVLQALEAELPELFGSGRRQEAMQVASELWSQRARQLSQQQEPKGQRQGGIPHPWPLVHSASCSGKLLLRLEYLLATGLQEQVRFRPRSEKTCTTKFDIFVEYTFFCCVHGYVAVGL